jgi:hypothetical protein
MELLVNGKFNDGELKELESELHSYNVKVIRYFTKGIDIGEIVRAIFRDFDAISFFRDGILFELLIEVSHRTINWIKHKKPKAEIQILVELDFGEDKPRVTFGIPTDDREIFKKQLEIAINKDFLDSLKKGEIISLAWDEDKKEIKVIRF